MTKLFAFTATVALGLIANARAEQPASTLTCIKVVGMIDSPMVPTPQAAREIYETVVRVRGDKFLQTNEILVQDDGEHWSIFQHSPGMRGGGTLEMRISKCDASIRAHYSR